MFSLIRDLYAYITSFTALLIVFKIGLFNESLQHSIIIITPLIFIAIHEFIVRKFKKEFDNQAYFSAIVAVALFAALGSLSQSELSSLGFKVIETHNYLMFKLYFHIWAIALLPIALKKFFKKD
ncbi:hypothetical protein ACLSZP_10545 [Avibacterium avium]|uniref:hypothetical protein n=1 Tax=Avibacterium avium TaxID=751 RepID=UPI003BF825AB